MSIKKWQQSWCSVSVRGLPYVHSGLNSTSGAVRLQVGGVGHNVTSTVCVSPTNIIYGLMELIVVRDAEGVDKSPHLENATSALPAEHNDLIHAAGRNCWSGKRPKEESGNKTQLKWQNVTFRRTQISITLKHLSSCFKGDKATPFGGAVIYVAWDSHANAAARRWRHPASHTSVPQTFVTLLSQNTGKVLGARRGKQEKERNISMSVSEWERETERAIWCLTALEKLRFMDV